MFIPGTVLHRSSRPAERHSKQQRAGTLTFIPLDSSPSPQTRDGVAVVPIQRETQREDRLVAPMNRDFLSVRVPRGHHLASGHPFSLIPLVHD